MKDRQDLIQDYQDKQDKGLLSPLVGGVPRQFNHNPFSEEQKIKDKFILKAEKEYDKVMRNPAYYGEARVKEVTEELQSVKNMSASDLVSKKILEEDLDRLFAGLFRI